MLSSLKGLCSSMVYNRSEDEGLKVTVKRHARRGEVVATMNSVISALYAFGVIFRAKDLPSS